MISFFWLLPQNCSTDARCHRRFVQVSRHHKNTLFEIWHRIRRLPNDFIFFFLVLLREVVLFGVGYRKSRLEIRHAKLNVLRMDQDQACFQSSDTRQVVQRQISKKPQFAQSFPSNIPDAQFTNHFVGLLVTAHAVTKRPSHEVTGLPPGICRNLPAKIVLH